MQYRKELLTKLYWEYGDFFLNELWEDFGGGGWKDQDILRSFVEA